MKIPFVDLKAQFASIERDVRARIDGVLAHGQFIMGPEVAELERALADFAGVAHAVGCASGTDALLLVLMAHDVGPGDLVFTTPFTFMASAEVVSLLGATPVFVDIDPRTFNLDPEALAAAVGAALSDARGRPKAVIAVDLFGLPADYERILAIAEAHDLLVVEDAAQSFGAESHGRPAGSLAHIGTTSFFPAKPLGAYGDAGAVFTDDEEIAARLDSIRVHGKGKEKYDNVRIGLNARIDTIQAAILLAKLAVFPRELEARRRLADRYTRGLEGRVGTPWVPEGQRSAWAQYSVLSDDRDALRGALQAQGIPTAIYYPKPLHLQTAYAGLGHRPGDLPVSEAAAARIFSLPMHAYLTEEQSDEIVRALRETAEPSAT